jgi:hypothetical protein
MRRIGAVILVLALSPGLAFATGQGQWTLSRWKSMDVCARQAHVQFPDYDALSNAKRDAAYKACLSSSSLPPRQPLSPPQPSPGQ